jgi:hypothetical protein
MANRPWLDDVRARLARHALPPSYIQRFTEELSDHLEDLMEENMSTASNVYSRLGEPEQVAKAAVTAYRRRGFFGRHPTAAFLVFAVSPIAAMIAVEAAALFFTISACELIGDNNLFNFTKKIGAFGQTTVPYILTVLTVVVPACLLTILYCQLAKRLSMKKGWMFASCAAVSVMAMCIFWSASFSDTPGQNVLRCGLWIPTLSGWIPPLQSLAQCIIPLAIGWWFIRRQCNPGQTQATT